VLSEFDAGIGIAAAFMACSLVMAISAHCAQKMREAYDFEEKCARANALADLASNWLGGASPAEAKMLFAKACGAADEVSAGGQSYCSAREPGAEACAARRLLFIGNAPQVVEVKSW
jgi:hypothetical protein